MNAQKIAIVTDSCSDLTPELIGDKPIFVIPLIIRCSRGEFRDGYEIHASDIYELLKTELPKTSLPQGTDMEKMLADIRAQGYEKVIAIMLSGMLSGTANLMRLAGEQCQGMEVRVLDSRSGSLGAGAMVLQTAEYIRQGYSWEELQPKVDALLEDTHAFFSVDTLEYLYKGGRIGRITAMAGSMLNIKPILSFTEEGELVNVAKVRGTKQVIERMVELVRKAKEEGRPFRLLVADGGVPEARAKMRAALENAFPGGVGVYETQIGATLSVYIGPGVIGAGIQML